MPAAATMVTQPIDGEPVSDSLPEIKANLATFGNVDPKSVTMRISGIGLVPATYDPREREGHSDRECDCQRKEERSSLVLNIRSNELPNRIRSIN